MDSERTKSEASTEVKESINDGDVPSSDVKLSQNVDGQDMTRQDSDDSDVVFMTSPNAGQGTSDGSQNHDSTDNVNEMTEKLNRELALSNTHRLEIQSHWRQVLGKEKFRELHDEIPQLIQYYEQNVSRKKGVISSLEREVRNLQELYQDAMVANMHRMEDLIAINDDQVVRLERDFRDRVSSLQSQFRTDIEEINSQYDKEKETVRECIQRQAEKDERQIKALRQEHQHELEEIKNRNLEHINSLRFVMDSRVEELEEEFEQTQGEFAQNTDGTRAAYDQLKSKDEEMRREIASKTRQANKLQREIQRFQLIAKQEEVQIDERHRELLARKSRAIARWNAMQEAMTRFRDEQQKRLVDLIRRANERKDALQRQCELAERVKKIALACQKLESSREKFASLLRESSCPVEKIERESPSERVDEDQRSFIIGCMGQLGDTTHRFWNKYNVAKLDVLILEKKVRRMKQREEDLKKKHKMYHDGITVNNDVLKDRNPLFVINGKMNAMPNNAHHGKKRVPRRLTVVDGNHFFVTNNMTQVA
mmetsp:Transcript_16577/g.39683  ORF Transcript_16577/g.39683 Transcript_16577/m.39683 type:complete len:538 (-) Transcript_16577:60-1673(-)